MAAIANLTATVLIQVGADAPKPIGTIEIPIEFSTGDHKADSKPVTTRSDRNGLVVNVAERKVVINEPGELSFDFMQAIIDGKLS